MTALADAGEPVPGTGWDLAALPVTEVSLGELVDRIEDIAGRALGGVPVRVILADEAAGRPPAGTQRVALEHEGRDFGVLQVPGPRSRRRTRHLEAIAAGAAGLLASHEHHRHLTQRLRDARAEALHDPLTGLPNRALLLDRLEHAMHRSRRRPGIVAVLFLDLDRFKVVNDLHGHAVGDQLLVAVASRLRSSLRQTDTAARIAGDEFVVICEQLAHEDEAVHVAERLRTALSRPFELSLLPNAPLEVSASIGIAFAGPAHEVPDRVLEEADAAMYLAKREGGRAHHLFQPAEQTVAQRRARLEHEMELAVGRGHIRPVYQPIVRTVDARPVAVEALLRWTHPEFGAVPPSEFVPIAGESGYLPRLGAWVLERACREHQAWPSVALSVNVSPQQLLLPEFPATVERVIDVTGTEPGSLILELTEEAIVLDDDRPRRTLEEVKALGVQLALDDFGVGSSSLRSLKWFAFDIVKIDRGFIGDLEKDPVSHAIVYSVAELAHLLGMIVVAEGVETDEQREIVTKLGCDYSQGFHFGRPAPLEDLLVLSA